MSEIAGLCNPTHISVVASCAVLVTIFTKLRCGSGARPIMCVRMKRT